MVEPTETETRELLDQRAQAFDAILAEAEDDPDTLQRGALQRSYGQASRRGRGQPQADLSAMYGEVAVPENGGIAFDGAFLTTFGAKT